MGNQLSRRLFLRGTGLSVIGVGLAPSGLMACAARVTPASGRAVLVHIFLRGGADGLSMVAPYADPLLYEMRGEVALPPPGKPGGMVAIDDHFAFHPGLAPLRSAYTEGRLAIVHGVGNYNVSRSHFSAQDFVELGTPGIPTTPTGTLDRLVGSLTGVGATKGVSFSSRTPVSFLGPEEVLVSLELAAFRLRAKNWQNEAEERIKAMYANTPLHRVATELFESIDVLRGAASAGSQPANGAVYEDSTFGNALRQAAQLIKAEIGTRCIFVSGDAGFDTHSGQVAAHATDFTALGSALAAFDRDLGKRIDDVVVIVSTEFGRTVFANGSHGTDHGSGYCAFVLGGKVRGGRIAGRWPGLAKGQLFEERDLAVTTDFRDLFLETVEGHFGGAAASRLFPGYAPGPKVGLFG